jgi:putative DNA primase/helicase
VTENNGFPDGLFVNEGTAERPELKGSRPGFVRWLMKEGIYAAPSDTFGERGFELFLYDGGLYRDGAPAFIHTRIEDAFEHVGLTSSKGFAQETVGSVARRSLKPRASFNPPGFLNLENGIYEITTGELHPHSPARRFTWQLPNKFDPAATCPTFLRFLAEVLPSEKMRHEIQKLFGYCIGVPGHPYQCAHLFVGEGSNGKSTLLSVLNWLLGKENVAAETLTSLTENRFAPANLWGKLANIFADLPSNPLRYTSVFKALTGGDKVRAEKKFGATFYFINGAKLVFSANELPEVNDRTRAFWRRWFLIRFDQNFTGREDRAMLGKLLAELPGILNWALAGIPMLQRDSGFLTELGADDLKSEWRRRSDSLAWFVSERVIVDPTGRTPKEEFFEAYAEFCARNQAAPKPPENVGKELPRHVPTIRTVKGRVDGDLVRFWLGICLRPDAGVQTPASPVSPASGGSQSRLPDGAEAGEASEAGSCTPARAGGDPGPLEPVIGPVLEEPENWTVGAKDRARPKGGGP